MRFSLLYYFHSLDPLFKRCILLSWYVNDRHIHLHFSKREFIFTDTHLASSHFTIIISINTSTASTHQPQSNVFDNFCTLSFHSIHISCHFVCENSGVECHLSVNLLINFYSCVHWSVFALLENRHSNVHIHRLIDFSIQINFKLINILW